MLSVYFEKEKSISFLSPVIKAIFQKNYGFLVTHEKPLDCDIIIYTHYKKSLPCSHKSLKIFVDPESGSDRSEAWGIPLSHAIGADIYIGPRANHSKMNGVGALCIDIPFASLSFGQRQLHTPLDLEQASIPDNWDNRHFCAYLASTPIPYRQHFYRRLRDSAKPYQLDVSALGKCRGRKLSRLESFLNAKKTTRHKENFMDISVGMISNYKFHLAMENEIVEGYITEKIVSAFLAGAIPIYWGTSDIFKIFNSDAMIYINSFPFTDLAIQHILDIARSPERCKKMLTAPKLAPGAMETFLSWHPAVPGDHLADRLRVLVRSAVQEKQSENVTVLPKIASLSN
jgi:hypothetical protein